MYRRNALSALTGLAAATILIGGRARYAGAATLAEPSYELQTLTVGTLAKQASQLALSNGSHPKVKEFAHFEVEEQTTIAQTLTRSNDPPPAPLPQSLQSQLEQLRGTTGKEFDAAYVRGQIQGHQQLLEIQQQFLAGNPGDLDRQHIAMLATAVIRMHLTMLADLQQVVGA